ncbi:MAG: thymidylate synthase [Candidatus Woesearchaeota archaeon]|nr:MAG: thymidylate synthase [Candidatus Woesearchaeota archaeon]
MEIHEQFVYNAWIKSLKYILDNGTDFIDRDKRNCREILNLVIIIDNPEEDYEKPIDEMQNFDWIYPSKEELESIMLHKENMSGYDYSYGPRIFNFRGVDQINNFIIPLLKSDPTSRRAVISLFDPSTDSNVMSKNIPSLLYIYFKIKNEKLDLTCSIRSNDLFIGWPGNIYQIVLLQRYVSHLLGIKTGSLTTISGSAHIFHEHFEIIEELLKRKNSQNIL